MKDLFSKARGAGARLADLRRYSFAKGEEQRRELTKDELKRRAKLEGLAARMKDGKNVQNRQLQTWLTAEEYARIHSDWEEQLELRKEVEDKPAELKQYEDILKRATFFFNRSEGYSTRRNSKAAREFWHKCQSACERAAEFLQEQLEADPSLEVWFDRNISLDTADGISADLSLLPRVLTSRSTNKLREDGRVMTKLEVKLNVVEQAIARIGVE